MWKRSSLKNKRYTFFAAALSALILLGGCAAQPVEADMAEAVTFTDALGREVAVPAEPERVAALIGSFADVWQLAGGELCAAAEDAWDDFGLELPGAVSIGGAHSPSLEALLAADPDFVIASASTAADVEMQAALDSAGIPAAYFDVDSFSDYLAMLDVCTDITGRKDLYEKNGLALEEKITAIREEVAAAQLAEAERSILLLRASSGFVKAKGSEGTILGEMLADLGCINLADSDRTLLEDLSVESVIQREPRHVFVVTMGDDTAKAMENLTRMLEENPAWGGLSAIREGRLHIMDRRLFNIKPNAEWAESYEILSDILLEKTA